MANDIITFIYDPARQGYDASLWKTLAGTPSAGSVITFNAATAIHYGDITKGEGTFVMNIPVEPTAGDERKWGFYSSATDKFIGFHVEDDQLYAKAGTAEAEIAWDDDWTSAAVAFKIVWNAGDVKFYIDGTPVAHLSEDADGTGVIPAGPLALYVSNENADNMTMNSITVSTRQYV